MFREAYELIIALDGKVYKGKDTQMLYGIYKKDNPEMFEQIEGFYQQGYIQDAERIAETKPIIKNISIVCHSFLSLVYL